jgi:hypothetical protein
MRSGKIIFLNEEETAAVKAASYLDSSSLSRSGLIA